jgi:hypothetical protein
LPIEEEDGGKMGANTDIHFTVLCFMTGTGHPVMCATILKSNKDVKESHGNGNSEPIFAKT